MKPLSRGFTLIELLVVITIISLLAAFLLPDLFSSQKQAHILADKVSMQQHFKWLKLYKNQKKHYPTRGGHHFVLAPWIAKICERTPENVARFFSVHIEDPRAVELKKMDLEQLRDLWRNHDELTSDDTHFAGRGRAWMKGNIEKGTEIWMATDNEGAPIYDDVVLALYGSGAVRELWEQEQLSQYWPEDAEDGYAFPVGPDSPHPDLKKLDY